MVGPICSLRANVRSAVCARGVSRPKIATSNHLRLRSRAQEPDAPDAVRAQEEEEDFEGLLPEEDWVVGGSDLGSLSVNTELGRAVEAALDELDVLSNLETGTLQQADELLKKMGLKRSLFDVQRAEEDTDGEQTQPGGADESA